jgi:hypothetical protein
VARRKEPVIKNGRQLAKIANFGMWGGLGARGFCRYAKGYGVVLDPFKETTSPEGLVQPSGTDLAAMFRAKWAEAGPYFERIASATRHGSFTLVQAQSLRQRGGVGYTDGCNGYFQGLVADWAKAATVAVSRAAYGDLTSPLWNIRPVLFLHDEIIAEIPDDHMTTVRANAMAKAMCAAAQPYAPDVPITASPAIMRRWYKGAEAVYAPDGVTLIPWEPPVDHKEEPTTVATPDDEEEGGEG